VPDPGEPAPNKKSPAYRIGGVVLGVALVVGIFVGVIPQFASYKDAWTAIAGMSPGWWAAIAVAAALSLAVAVWPFQAALPRLRYWPGFLGTQTSTAVSATVPAGGAVALGLTYRMFGSFGFTAVAITSAVATTATPFEWKFTKSDLTLLLKRIAAHEPAPALAA
jgi:uncharacterized membrane protein YbhN (UPF0104 family)